MYSKIFVFATTVLAVITTCIADPDGYGKGKGAPMPYSFDYNVKADYHKGPNFEHSENSDGKGVKGSYSVHLPDGRKQTVEYTVDDYSGFVAKISYEGKAQHPKKFGPPVTFDFNGKGGHGDKGGNGGHGGGYGGGNGGGYGGHGGHGGYGGGHDDGYGDDHDAYY